MSEISGFFYCAKCDKNTSFCGGVENDHKTRGNNTEWKYKDNKWAIKNKYNGWSDFKKLTYNEIHDIVFCDNCFDEKPFIDFIKDYPSIIINHLVDRINI